MNYRYFSITLALLLSYTVPLVAQPLNAGFYSGGKFHAITIDKDLVALPSSTQKAPTKIHLFHALELKKFAEIGLVLIPLKSQKNRMDIVGYPMWFNRDAGAIGVLTHEILVRSDSSEARSMIQKTAGVTNIAETKFKKGLYLVKYSSPEAALTAANKLFTQPNIIYSHPNFRMPKDFREQTTSAKRFFPSDEPLFPAQWHLHNTGQNQGVAEADIKAKHAWSISTGHPEIKIAIIDGGFEIAHEDLRNRWFVNQGEIAGDGLDNDGNGYADDVQGWNFWAKSADHHDSIYSQHGTAVAGLVGATVNSIGVTGVCPECTIIPITTSYVPADDAAAIYYAGHLEADIITNSWGYLIGTPKTDVVVEAIKEVVGSGRKGKKTVILFAMSNSDHNDCVGERPDLSSLPEVVAISASTNRDVKLKKSGWGSCLKFLAPSSTERLAESGIVTTDLVGEAGYNPKRVLGDLTNTNYTAGFSGTSAATPIVAGIFGLLFSVDPDLTKDQAIELMKSSAEKIFPADANYDLVSGFSEHYGYGRVDAAETLLSALIRKRRLGLLHHKN
jgi:subtilisin family serine protease